MSIVWLLWGEGEMLTSSPGEENNEQSNHQSELNFFNMDIEPDMMPSVSVEPKGMSHVIDIPNTKKARAASTSNDNMQIAMSQEKNSPRITKIIVFYDDNTFESFVNSKTVTTPQK